MDAHVFRLLGLELAVFLRGARVEKIHSPAPGLFALTAYNFGVKRIVTLKHDKAWNPSSRKVGSIKQDREPPALYLTGQRLPNPEKPSTLVMTLRKYLTGRRLGAATLDWLNRRIYFFVPQAKGRELNNSPPLWFCLDLVHGPSLQSALPEIEPPLWPDPQILGHDHRETASQQSVWKNYPVLSPPLRKTLQELDGPDGAALLADLEYEAEQGSGSLFLYSFNAQPHLLSAWPLPPAQAADLEESVLPESPALAGKIACEAQVPVLEGFLDSLSSPEAESSFLDKSQCDTNVAPTQENNACDTNVASPQSFALNGFPYLQAARSVYEPRIVASLDLFLQKDQLREEGGSKRRLKKTLEKLEQEEDRLKKLCDLQAGALALQSALWKYPAEQKMASLVIPAVEAPNGEELNVSLDATKTLRENMAFMFKQAARGQRGLDMLAQRKKSLQEELRDLEDGLGAPLSQTRGRAGAGQREFNEKAVTKHGQAQGRNVAKLGQQQGRPDGNRGYLSGQAAARQGQKPTGTASKEAAQVQRFVSSDGFVILRGKSAKGNQALLKLAQPHDLWLHVEGGPSAHVVIRRSNLAVEIPERTLNEAGILSGLKSWRKQDDRAEIITALVKDVRPVKGGAPGSVLVDKQQKSLLVTLDSELEERLKES